MATHVNEQIAFNDYMERHGLYRIMDTLAASLMTMPSDPTVILRQEFDKIIIPYPNQKSNGNEVATSSTSSSGATTVLQAPSSVRPSDIPQYTKRYLEPIQGLVAKDDAIPCPRAVEILKRLVNVVSVMDDECLELLENMCSHTEAAVKSGQTAIHIDTLTEAFWSQSVKPTPIDPAPIDEMLLMEIQYPNADNGQVAETIDAVLKSSRNIPETAQDALSAWNDLKDSHEYSFCSYCKTIVPKQKKHSHPDLAIGTAIIRPPTVSDYLTAAESLLRSVDGVETPSPVEYILAVLFRNPGPHLNALNKILTLGEEEELTTIAPMLKMLKIAMERLPDLDSYYLHPHGVYRSVEIPLGVSLAEQYTPNTQFRWNSYSKAYLSMPSEKGRISSGDGVLFQTVVFQVRTRKAKGRVMTGWERDPFVILPPNVLYRVVGSTNSVIVVEDAE
eukprot:PhF_6_TR22531/c1_g1_i3/m.31998